MESVIQNFSFRFELISYLNTKNLIVARANQDDFYTHPSLITYNTISMVFQSSKHFTSPTTPWSQRV